MTSVIPFFFLLVFYTGKRFDIVILHLETLKNSGKNITDKKFNKKLETIINEHQEAIG